MSILDMTPEARTALLTERLEHSHLAVDGDRLRAERKAADRSQARRTTDERIAYLKATRSADSVSLGRQELAAAPAHQPPTEPVVVGSPTPAKARHDSAVADRADTEYRRADRRAKLDLGPVGGALAEIIPLGATWTPEPDGKPWAERFAAAARQIAVHYGTEQADEHAYLATGLNRIAKLGAPWVELDDDRPRVCEANKGSVGFEL